MIFTRKPFSRATVLAFFIAAMTVVAGPAAAKDALPHGPKVGTSINEKLTGLRDHKGTAQTLGMLTGKRGLILIFSRSLSW